jgi:hypothetical protein
MSQPQPSPDPVSSRTTRHDSLTPERQAEFLATLAATGNISEAAAAAGISRTALYRLRGSPEGAAFRARWAEALRDATAVLAEAAFDRALNGASEPVWYKGEQIGERVRYNDRLLMFLLRSHDPDTYARPDRPAQHPAQSARPAAGSSRTAQDLAPRTPRFGVNFVSTSEVAPEQNGPEANTPEDDMDDETFRAELRKLRGSPELPRRLSKRNARRLAAKGRLPAAHPT